MASNYDRHIFRQLEEVLKKCDNLSQEIKDIKKQHKQEIYELNQKHEKEVKELREQYELENKDQIKESDILKEKNMLFRIFGIDKIEEFMEENEIQIEEESE